MLINFQLQRTDESEKAKITSSNSRLYLDAKAQSRTITYSSIKLTMETSKVKQLQKKIASINTFWRLA